METGSYFRQFVLPFSGLSYGNHEYRYHLNDTFFDGFEYSEIKHGAIDIVLSLEKQERMLILDFNFEGNAECICDRCGENYSQQLSGEQRLIVKFGEDKSLETDEVMIVGESEHQIDLSQLLYEFSVLLLPLKRVHPDLPDGTTGCDPGILEKINELTPKTKTDPRWDDLKKLLS